MYYFMLQGNCLKQSLAINDDSTVALANEKTDLLVNSFLS